MSELRNDDAYNALLRRVHADEMVKRWAKALDDKIERIEAREVRPGASRSGLAQLELDEALTLRELVSRGLDLQYSRRFRGRIALTIRCPQKGHALAHVYPTRREPVLVPCMRVVTRKQTEAQKAAARKHLKWEQENTPWMSDAVRDPWVRAVEDYDGHIDFEIEGLVILKEGYRREQVEHETLGLARPACFLQCRCGEQLVAGADVMRALDAGRQNLVAVWDI